MSTHFLLYIIMFIAFFRCDDIFKCGRYRYFVCEKQVPYEVFSMCVPFSWISKSKESSLQGTNFFLILSIFIFFCMPCVRCYYTLFCAVFAIDNKKKFRIKKRRTSCLHGITRNTQCSKFISDFTFRSVRFYTPFSLLSSSSYSLALFFFFD